MTDAWNMLLERAKKFPNTPCPVLPRGQETIGELHQQLLDRCHEREPLVRETLDGWTHAIEDMVYRYYHQSFKVFYIQGFVEQALWALASLHPQANLDFFEQEEIGNVYTGKEIFAVLMNQDFLNIIQDGTSGGFNSATTNSNWDRETRPVMMAAFHTKFMLDMALKSAHKYSEAPEILPIDWAALLYLFNLR